MSWRRIKFPSQWRLILSKPSKNWPRTLKQNPASRLRRLFLQRVIFTARLSTALPMTSFYPLMRKDGLADQQFVYARGQVILWSANKDFCKAATWQDALKNDRIKKIAIVNPATAPYGAAAKVALQKAGLGDALQSKLVNAQDIAQSFQYANTSAVDAGFCSLSATASPEGKSGCFFIIAEAPAIVQSACIMKRTKNRAVVERFAEFLVSPEANKIKMKFGYR